VLRSGAVAEGYSKESNERDSGFFRLAAIFFFGFRRGRDKPRESSLLYERRGCPFRICCDSPVSLPVREKACPSSPRALRDSLLPLAPWPAPRQRSTSLRRASPPLSLLSLLLHFIRLTDTLLLRSSSSSSRASPKPPRRPQPPPHGQAAPSTSRPQRTAPERPTLARPLAASPAPFRRPLCSRPSPAPRRGVPTSARDSLRRPGRPLRCRCRSRRALRTSAAPCSGASARRLCVVPSLVLSDSPGSAESLRESTRWSRSWTRSPQAAQKRQPCRSTDAQNESMLGFEFRRSA
jgi:hypothetical protein